MSSNVNAAALATAMAQFAGGIPGLVGQQYRPQPGVVFLRGAPGYRADMQLPFDVKRVHRHVFNDKGQPPVCLGILGKPCLACARSKQYKADPMLGEWSKSIFASNVAWWQVLEHGKLDAGWQYWPIGKKVIETVYALLQMYPDLCNLQTGRWLQVTFAKNGEWTNLVSMIPAPAGNAVDPVLCNRLQNLDPAWRIVSEEEMAKALSVSTPGGAAAAPGFSAGAPAGFPGGFPTGGFPAGGSGFATGPSSAGMPPGFGSPVQPVAIPGPQATPPGFAAAPPPAPPAAPQVPQQGFPTPPPPPGPPGFGGFPQATQAPQGVPQGFQPQGFTGFPQAPQAAPQGFPQQGFATPAPTIGWQQPPPATPTQGFVAAPQGYPPANGGAPQFPPAPGYPQQGQPAPTPGVGAGLDAASLAQIDAELKARGIQGVQQ